MQRRILFCLSSCAVGLALGGLAEAQQARETGAGADRLSFADFFVTPVGAEGLEPTARLLALQGKRVTLTGYMVQEQEEEHHHAAETCAAVVRRFMLTAAPQSINPGHYGPCDGLPPQVLYVHVADAPAAALPHRAGLLRVTGRLEVGPQREADERISMVRLHLDAGSVFSAAAPE